MRVLVLITGTGRSGTSTMSGTLHHLGLDVPGPYLGANESNPKGFFENRWSVKFHKALVERAGIHEFDSRPSALERVQAAVTADTRAEVSGWVREHADGVSQLVVKDPRSVFTQALWRDAAAESGMEIRYISMLRHPAEVVGSRATNYASSEEKKRREYEIFNVARWINNSLINERETRGQRRAFVRYNDLLEDWRDALLRIGDGLGLTFDSDLTSAPGSHPVDEFIDPSLRRHQVTWAELSVPRDLQDLAQEIWDRLMVLGDAGGDDTQASADLDLLAERYARLFEEATAISHDAIEEAVRDAREAGMRRARAEAAEHRNTPQRRPAGRLVEETGARDLLQIAGRRLIARLRR
jgi:hypothetical protein